MPHMREFEPILPDPQPYVEKALALYERAVRERRGRVVFLAAELGGGKTEHLNALARALRQAQPAPHFIAGFFRGGEYSRYKLDWQENICLKKAILAAGETASLLSLIPSPYTFAASFVGQLLQTSVSTHELGDEFKRNPPPREESAAWLKRLLRRAAAEKPLVCLLDDWDEAQRFYWDDMLLSFAREIAQDLPLLLFITVKEPLSLDAPAEDESGLAAVIKSLSEKGLAEWWPLRKLSRDEVAAAIGQAAPGIAAKLHGVTGGNARWVRELWREWRLSNIVVPNEADCWVWGGQHKTTVNLYEDILSDCLSRLLKAQTAMEVEAAREVLACAALEGVRFTADAVALALDWDRDELIDFLDETLVQTDDNQDGLLREDDSAQIVLPDGTTRTLWRYSFVSDLHWQALDRYGFANEQRPDRSDSERREKSAGLIRALQETYAPEERFAAAPIARLLRAIGQEETAQHYQRMADYAANREVMRAQALYLLATNKDDWEQWQCGRGAEFLIEAGRAMLNAFPLNETLAVAEEAYKLARRAKYESTEAHARYLCGNIFYLEGEFKLAREQAQGSLSIYQRIRKKDGVSVSLCLLAKIGYEEGRYAEARKQAAQALEIDQELGNRHGLGGELTLLALIDHEEGRYAEARKQAASSLEIFQKTGNHKGISISLNLLARINYEEGRLAEAREQAAQALEIAQEMGDPYGVSISLQVLSAIAYEFEQSDEAGRLSTLGVMILTQIGHTNAQKFERDLADWFAEQEYTEEQQQELRRQMSEAYEKDGGAELIEHALARLRAADG